MICDSMTPGRVSAPQQHGSLLSTHQPIRCVQTIRVEAGGCRVDGMPSPTVDLHVICWMTTQ